MKSLIHVLLAFAVTLAGAAPASARDQNARSQSRASVNQNRNTNVNQNRNTNINQNRNVNVNSNRNVNVNVDRDVNVNVHGGGYYGGGCCYHPVATAAAVTATAVVTAAVVGSMVNTLPPSCTVVAVGGISYQQCGSTWYQPQFAGGNTTYVVVNAPR